MENFLTKVEKKSRFTPYQLQIQLRNVLIYRSKSITLNALDRSSISSLGNILSNCDDGRYFNEMILTFSF